MTSEEFLSSMSWVQALTSVQRLRLSREVREREVPSGMMVCRHGHRVEFWKGVVDGLVKLSIGSSDGRMSTLTGLAAGAWFGEGPVLRSQRWDFDGVALRDTRLVLVPRATFLWLMADSPVFNTFIVAQMAERMAQFVAILEAERLASGPERVARCLGWLFNPVLYPRREMRLDLTQQEIAYVSGVSRQRVNLALRLLEQAGLLTVGYGTVDVLDLQGLLDFTAEGVGSTTADSVRIAAP